MVLVDRTLCLCGAYPLRQGTPLFAYLALRCGDLYHAIALLVLLHLCRQYTASLRRGHLSCVSSHIARSHPQYLPFPHWISPAFINAFTTNVLCDACGQYSRAASVVSSKIASSCFFQSVIHGTSMSAKCTVLKDCMGGILRSGWPSFEQHRRRQQVSRLVE